MWNTYYKDRLSPSGQAVYDTLCAELASHRQNIAVGRTEEQFSRILRAVNYDRPDFFFVNWLDRITYRQTLFGGTLHFNFLYTEEESAAIGQQITDIAKSIPGISSYGKALGVHDWFVKNIRYDHKGLKQMIRSPGMFSAAGPLLCQKAVCEGVSKLACCLLRKKGVDAAMVVGSTNEGGPHAWNALTVEGAEVYADITFDMGLSSRHRIRQDYFLLSREEMARDRSFSFF